MRFAGLVAAVPLLTGAALGIVIRIEGDGARDILGWLCAAACASFVMDRFAAKRRSSIAWLTAALIALGFGAAGTALAADARDEALGSSLRTLLHNRFGGFDIHTLGPEGDHDPLPITFTLTEDAAPGDGFVGLRGVVTTVTLQSVDHPVWGGVTVSVGGTAAFNRLLEWRAGRRLQMPVTFRRPARYLNDAVRDDERALALDGTALFASVKSGLLIDVASSGSPLEELSADVRAYVRHIVAARVAPFSAVSAAIVSAVLIGDRTGLPDDVRDRLQAAGTYHVIAISGGNIAILVGVGLLALMVCGIRGRVAAALTIGILVAYAHVVTSGPSVWRATLVAIVYLAARAVDHRTAGWQAAAVAAALMAVAQPLDVRSPGFILTFGASAALIEGARRGGAAFGQHRAIAWLVAPAIGSLAVEAVLLPVSAYMFSRVTGAGPALNLLAVPLMVIVQCAGMLLVLCGSLDPIAWPAAWMAHVSATALVSSASLIELAPWLVTRVPPPAFAVLTVYYAALGLALWARPPHIRFVARMVLGGAIVAIVTGLSTSAAFGSWITSTTHEPVPLRLTMFDVGQGESVLLESRRRTLLVDTGGAPFGGGSFDVGARVLAPALWARGLRSLDTLLLTHGDPDHLGGARGLLDAVPASELWEGVAVPSHGPMNRLRDEALRRGSTVHPRRAGEVIAFGGARVRVLHPPEPDWERQRIRNDDSVVLEVLFGDAALLLTGDISAEIERALIPALTRAPLRVLKIGHHGSRTSTSSELLEAWQPQLALVSAGRGNTFGHPATEVLRRLENLGATVLRTDRHGEITIETDGKRLKARTYTGLLAEIPATTQ